MPIAFADRLNNVETSAIRELFKLLGKPGIISFAGGFPDSAMFDVEGISAASQRAIGTGVVGGMITGTVLAVIFVPAFFVLVRGFFKGSKRQQERDLQTAQQHIEQANHV